MINMDDLIAGQYEVAETIKKILINYKKDSNEKKTEEYVKRRLANLENNWADFCQRHRQITVDESHQYVRSRVFDQVEDKYNATKMVLNEKAEALSLQRQLLSKTTNVGESSPNRSKLRAPPPPPATPSGSMVNPNVIQVVHKNYHRNSCGYRYLR